MARFHRRTTASLALLLALSFGGCEPGLPPNDPVGTPPPPPGRPSDGLMEDRTLQMVVDRQVERDAGALVANLADPAHRVRARAAFALASVQDPAAAPALARALRDPEPPVRRDAAFALGQLPTAASGSFLLDALAEETDPEVRRRLLEAVGKVGDERTLERLLGLDLEPEESPSRNLAVSRMGIRGVTLPSAVRHLVGALRDADPRARENAGYYFGRTPAPSPWSAWAPEVRAVLDSLPPSDPLAMHLLLGLANLEEPQDTPRFLWWLRTSPDWRVRANAARAAGGGAREPRTRMALMAALDDPSTHVAHFAAGALTAGPRLPPGELDGLRSWIRDHPDDWRRAGPILSLLGREGDGAFIQAWLEGWEKGDVIPRTRGIGALAFVPGNEAFQVLLDAVRDPDPRIRGTALNGLARRWRVEREDPTTHSAYFQAFSLGLRSGDPASSFVAAPALADSAFLALGSVELLLQTYERLAAPGDLDAMQAVLTALGETGDSAVEGALRKASGHPVPAIRRAGLEALARLEGEEPLVEDEATPAERRVDWEALAALGPAPRLVLETEKGTVLLVLDAESAPLTVQTIAGFAGDGKLDGVPFHRVVPNFVVQGGDFARKDGYGGPGFKIRSEFTETPYRRGVLGMASSGKDTEGSQFFITHSMQPHLDGAYTAFGWVEAGMDVVDSLYEWDLIVSARIEPGLE